jgi:hypothetical protein
MPTGFGIASCATTFGADAALFSFKLLQPVVGNFPPVSVVMPANLPLIKADVTSLQVFFEVISQQYYWRIGITVA